MPFKISTKSENYVVFPGTNWVKTFFFRCEFFNETWFLNKNWNQKLSFWKKFLLQIMIIRNVLYSKSAGTKNSQFKTWHFGIFSFNFSLSRKTFASESDYFFSGNFISNSDFQWKRFLQFMPFKMSMQSEKLVVGRGANRVKTLFLRPDVFIEIWFLNENWIQNLNFRKKFSLHKTIIGKIFFETRQDEKLSI